MFEKIIGNNKIKQSLVNLIKHDNVLHSYLFVGTEGIGKKMIAEEFSKGILCLNNGEKCCNKCKSCIEFNAQSNPDYMKIEPDGNSIKVNQIREMQSKIQEKPIISNNKIYVINDADLMTKEAQNCLLKTLEEPPEYAKIILVGTNENEFLSTIKSRCMIIRFEKITDEEMKKFLKEEFAKTSISEEELEIFQGSIKKAKTLNSKEDKYRQIHLAIKNIEKVNLIDFINSLEILYKSKDEILEMLDYINSILLKKSRNNIKYTSCIKIVEETKARLKQNGNYDMCIDNMLFNIWEEVI